MPYILTVLVLSFACCYLALGKLIVTEHLKSAKRYARILEEQLDHRSGVIKSMRKEIDRCHELLKQKKVSGE